MNGPTTPMPEVLRPSFNQFLPTPLGVPAALAPRTRMARHDSTRAVGQFVQAEHLSVVFQPIVSFDPMRIFAYEALLRCTLPAYHDPPALFRRAHEGHCSGRLGRMVREIAIPLCPGVPVFLNVHPKELEERWLVQPDDPMYFHDGPVFLEITEAVPMQQLQLCRDVLNEVRWRGNIQLVVDDFGAGYSNLKHIVDLEPTIVKLDRGLIAGCERGTRQQRLIAGVVRLCEDLGAQVVAEGIETESELRALRGAGIHLGQGYLFARPGFPLPTVDPRLNEVR